MYTLYYINFLVLPQYVCLQKITLVYIIARFRWCSYGSLLVALPCAILPRSTIVSLHIFSQLSIKPCSKIHMYTCRTSKRQTICVSQSTHSTLVLPVEQIYGATKDTYSRITREIDVFRCCNGVFSPKYTVDFPCNSRVSIKNTQCHIRHEKFIHHHSEIMEKCSSYSYQFA